MLRFHFDLTPPARGMTQVVSGADKLGNTYQTTTSATAEFVSPDRSKFFRSQRRPDATEPTRTTPTFDYTNYSNLQSLRQYTPWIDDSRAFPTMNPAWMTATPSPLYISPDTFVNWYLAMTLFLMVLIALLRYTCKHLRKRRPVLPVAAPVLPVAAETVNRPGRITERLHRTDEEIAQILAAREEMVYRLIFTLIAQEQAAEERQRLTATDTPLSAGEMEQLPRTEITGPSDDICPTCQQNFTEGELKIVLPCTHVGHEACLTTWLTTYSRKCPVCRQPVFVDDTAGSPPNSDVLLDVDT
ncbi:uncharacterized protein LOC129589908 isoform X2 [Paramacrobiotus metropolitanus]|uniref:uncharacterized protein LOC129589908 isoform X2 n=1 Tax=Paramacrobiotus metropolitanus TaxID=2943436 RepID=UPI0024457437|nr:uncharacterized protein LOC129589908 isoform X2 [Paramacrobiotus metropolitanus]